MAVLLLYFIVSSSVKNEALFIALPYLLGAKQGNTRELEWLFLGCEATLSFENNSVEKKSDTQQYICDKG